MFSQRLKLLRKEKGYTQSELAKCINSSLSKIAMWETKKRDPVKEDLLVLSELFNVSIDYLLGKTDLRNTELIQQISRPNRLKDYKSLNLDNLDKDTLIYMTQNMIDKIDNTYILKQLYLSIYLQLDTYGLIDEVKDKDLVRLRNYLAHCRPSDEELKDFLNIYKNRENILK